MHKFSFSFRKVRVFYEADGQGGGTPPPPAPSEDEKAKLEIARLGKLVNEYAEKEKSRQLEETKRQEEEAKKKGEFESLANDYKTRLDTLTSEHTSASDKLAKYDEYFKTSFENSLKTLEKGQKEMIEKLLDGKSNFEKSTLLPDILATFGNVKQFGKDPTGGKPPAGVDQTADLLKKGDVAGSLSLKLSQK